MTDAANAPLPNALVARWVGCGLLSLFATSCVHAQYTYLGRSYPSAEQAIDSQQEIRSALLERIEPRSAPAAGHLLMLLPDANTLATETFTVVGPLTSLTVAQREALASLANSDLEIRLAMISRRNIFRGVTAIVESSSEQPPDWDYAIWPVLRQGRNQWHLMGRDWAEAWPINLDPTADGEAVLETWLASLERLTMLGHEPPRRADAGKMVTPGAMQSAQAPGTSAVDSKLLLGASVVFDFGSAHGALATRGDEGLHPYFGGNAGAEVEVTSPTARMGLAAFALFLRQGPWAGGARVEWAHTDMKKQVRAAWGEAFDEQYTADFMRFDTLSAGPMVQWRREFSDDMIEIPLALTVGPVFNGRIRRDPLLRHFASEGARAGGTGINGWVADLALTARWRNMVGVFFEVGFRTSHAELTQREQLDPEIDETSSVGILGPILAVGVLR